MKANYQVWVSHHERDKDCPIIIFVSEPFDGSSFEDTFPHLKIGSTGYMYCGSWSTLKEAWNEHNDYDDGILRKICAHENLPAWITSEYDERLILSRVRVVYSGFTTPDFVGFVNGAGIL